MQADIRSSMQRQRRLNKLHVLTFKRILGKLGCNLVRTVAQDDHPRLNSEPDRIVADFKYRSSQNGRAFSRLGSHAAFEYHPARALRSRRP